MSPELKQFYVELQDWVDSGCKTHPIFRSCYGICSNLNSWLYRKNIYYRNFNVGEFEKSFIDSGLDVVYPWGEHDYVERRDNSTMYECPKRLAWIKEHAQ